MNPNCSLTVTPYHRFSKTKKNTAKSFVKGLLLSVAVTIISTSGHTQSNISGISLGGLTDYLFVFTDGNVDANWQAASKGYAGDVAVNGKTAHERTSGNFAYAGTIYTNDNTLGAYQQIVNNNHGQAHKRINQASCLTNLQNDLQSAFLQINAKPVTAGYEGRNASSLNGLNTQNGIAETFVINITSGFNVSTFINITGDAEDLFLMRWDTDQNFSNGYNGQVKFQSGGAIVPHGGLIPTNFIHVAGDIGSSGGGNAPPLPYPKGPRHADGTGTLITNGVDFRGGGFFTGYWLTKGNPSNGQTSSLSNAIFVGGWYTSTTKFSLTSGSSGVHVSPPISLLGTMFSRVVPDTGGDKSQPATIFKCYPNPVINEMHMTFPAEWQNKAIKLEISNANGQVITKSQTANSTHTETFNMAHFRPGLYIVKLTCGKETVIHKLIKQ